jgi:hypothetical protein
MKQRSDKHLQATFISTITNSSNGTKQRGTRDIHLNNIRMTSKPLHINVLKSDAIAYEKVRRIQKEQNNEFEEFHVPSDRPSLQRLIYALQLCETSSDDDTTQSFSVDTRIMTCRLILEQRFQQELLSFGLADEQDIIDLNQEDVIETAEIKYITKASYQHSYIARIQQKGTTFSIDDKSWSENDPNDEELVQLTIGESNKVQTL